MSRRRRLPLVLYLLRLVGHLWAVAGYLPLAASRQSTTYQCGGTLTDSSYLQSPNYPENYPNGVTCTWQFLSKSSTSNLTLQFYAFDLEQQFDYVFVYDEHGIARNFTGRSLPPTIPLGSSGRMIFFSDSTIGFSGFRVYFKSTDMGKLSQCTTSDVFWCASSQKCISSAHYCDGHMDCEYKEDESHCSSSSKELSTNLAISIPLTIGSAILVISLVVVYKRRCKLKHPCDSQWLPRVARRPVAENITFPIETASPAQLAQTVSTVDPPFYFDLVSNSDSTMLEPPAYDSV